jgi:hypothetical protein
MLGRKVGLDPSEHDLHVSVPSTEDCPQCGRTMFDGKCVCCSTSSGPGMSTGPSVSMNIPPPPKLQATGTYKAPSWQGAGVPTARSMIDREKGRPVKKCPKCGKDINPVIGECVYCD